MNRKALFFDIDGTLFSEIDRQVPQSAALALKKARENGHLVFINTGRTYCQTAGIRKEVEMDGLLCGCGTYLIAQEVVLYDGKIPAARRSAIKDVIVKCNLAAVLEGAESCSLIDRFPKTADMEWMRNYLMREGCYAPGGYEDDTFEFSKFCVLGDSASDMESFHASMKDFDVIDRGGNFYECVPEGHSKATAIEFILNRYGIQKEDAWVFGDSMNDLSMFRYSSNAVLMGKHDEGLEPYATFLTRTVEEDGIWYAMEKLGMI